MSSNNPNEQNHSTNGPAAKKSKQNGIPRPTVTPTSTNQYNVTVPGLPAHLTQFAGQALYQFAGLLTNLTYEINIRVDEKQHYVKLQNADADLINQLIELRKAYEMNKLGLEAANQKIQQFKDLGASMSPIRPAPSPELNFEEADPVASMSGNPEAPEEERPEPVQRATRRKQIRSDNGTKDKRVTRRKTGKETGGRQQRRRRSIEGKTKRARETNDEEDRILGFLEEARKQMSEERRDIIAVGTDDPVASPEEEPPVQKVAPLKKQLLVFYPDTKEHHEYIRYRTDLYSQSLANKSVYQFMPTNKHLYDCRDKACLPQPVERAPRLCEYEALFPPKTHTTKGWQAAQNAEKLLEKLRVEQRRQLDANMFPNNMNIPLAILLLFTVEFAHLRPLPADDDTGPASKKLKTEGNPASTTKLKGVEVQANQKSNEKCYFETEKISSLEKYPRDWYTKVSTKCEGDLREWSTIVGVFNGNLHGAYNEMDLLAGRGGGEYHDFDDAATTAEVGKRLICSNHLKELVTNWNNNQHVRKDETSTSSYNAFKCGMPPSVSKHDSNIPRTAGGGNFLTRDEAKQLLTEQHVHVHIGTPLCKAHKSSVSIAHCTQKFETTSYLDEPITSRLRSALTSRSNSETCSDISQPNSPGASQSQSGVDFSGAVDDQASQNANGVCKSKFIEWAESLNLKFLSSRKPYSSLTKRSKRRKAIATKELLSVAFELLAPGHAEDLKTLTFEEETDEWTSVRAKLFDDLMRNIVSEYYQQKSRRERRGLLSLVTSMLPYSTVLKYFPGLSRYEFTKSRMLAAMLNRAPYESLKRERFTKEYVIEFVDFATSPAVRTDLPYGRRTLKKSDGSKLEISDTLRNLRAVEIIEMFIKLKTENGEEAHLLSRSTMYKILDKCKATKREALECVDYFLSDALDSFDKMFDTLKSMKLNGYIDENTEKDFNKRLHQSKLYLQTDYKLHLKFESKIADHCIQFSLSDPKEKLFDASCENGETPHSHNQNSCEKCQAIRDVFDDFTGTVKELIESAEKNTLRATQEENVKSRSDLTIILNDISTAEKDVLEFKKHLVRNKHSNSVRQKIVESLTPEEAFLTLDWSQKVLPQQARESQSDYFGKSGISVHCTHVLNIDGSGNLRQHNFIHITKHEVQDSITVLLILENVLAELKKVGILRVHLRSDNAGCYHSTKTITSLPELSQKTGVNIMSYTFSEAQGGKGAADRAASEMKRKLRSWLGSGKNTETPDEIFSALTEGRVPAAMSTHLCSIDRSTVQEGTTVIKGIQNFYDFRFEKSQMTARKFGWIGSGETKNTKLFVPSKGSMVVEKSGGFLPSDSVTFWKDSKCSGKCSGNNIEVSEDFVTFSDANVNVDQAKPKPMETAVFTCPQEECDATFLKLGNLEAHIAFGKHKKVPERENIFDVAVNRYADNIEGLKEEKSSSTLKEVFVDLPIGSIEFVNSKGWAQPSKKTNKRYDKEVVQFVMNKFEQASKNKQKVYPKIIAQELRESKKADGSSSFLPEHWLNYKQVLNLYQTFGRKSRELAAKEKAGDASSLSATTISPTTTTTSTPASQKTPLSSHSAAASSKKNEKGANRRPKREETKTLIDAVIEELEKQEFDDSEDVYDNNHEEPSDFDNVMAEVEKNKALIFEK